MKKKFIKPSDLMINIIYYGTATSFGLLILGIFAYKANEIFWGSSFVNYEWSIKLISSAMSLFVQSFVFALLFECVRLGTKK